FNVIFASGSAFILLRQISEAKLFTSQGTHDLMRSLATSAFGIYLVHVLVIEVLSFNLPLIHMNSFMGSALWSIPFVSTIVFIISFWITRFIQKIPVLNYIVP